MNARPFCVALVAIVGSTLAPVRADESDAQLARKARTIREQYCHRCHGKDGTAKGGFGYILDNQQLVKNKQIVPGHPDRSELLARIKEGSMPFEGVKPRPTADEIATLEKWIKAGAPEVRPFRDESDVLRLIRDHLRDKTPERDRPFQRYFTLANLHNNADVSDQELRLHRDALAKLVKSLSRKEIVVPQSLDADGIVFSVDLRKLGWDEKNLWQELLKVYPYGVLHHGGTDKLRELADKVAELSDPKCELPYVRADWFVATASRPALYQTMRGPVQDKQVPADIAKSIAPLVGRYQRELGLEDVARELGLPDAKGLRSQLEGKPKLLDWGLVPVTRGGTIKRETWASRSGVRTLFQEAASELRLGTPLTVD